MWQFKMSVNRMRFFFVLTSNNKCSRTRFIKRTEAQKNTKKCTNLKLQIDKFNLCIPRLHLFSNNVSVILVMELIEK